MASRGIDRRAFLIALAGAAAAGACTSTDGSGASGPTPSSTAGTTASTTGTLAAPLPVPDLPGDPFTLGVASGDPLADRVVLWTRLAPDPLGGGGMPPVDVPVRWEVARDEAFDEIVTAGDALATAALGHSVHVDAGGLDPDSWYHYRFVVGDHTSPTGRTRTTPADGELPAGGSLRVGFGSCQSYTSGHYSAYPHAIAEELDVFVFLGDFIYEGGVGGADAVRQHDGPEVTTLDGYRNRYGLYIGDPALAAARGAMPWLVIWDDHEVDNDYAGAVSQDDDPVDAFLARRAAAYQAWYEHQPVRLEPPVGADLEIHREVRWGSLTTFWLTDERQYRDPHACGGSIAGDCDERTDTGRTLLGAEQRAWLADGLAASTSTWNVVANELVMAAMPLATVYNMDQWDGYRADQRAVAEMFAARPDLNPIVITGDIHAFGAADLKVDYDDPDAAVVGVEFVGGSISSRFNDAYREVVEPLVSTLPHVRFLDARHNGYGVLDLTDERCRCELRIVSTTEQPEADISTAATLEVRAGAPGIEVL